jgi:hypothetical protein
VLNNEVAMEWEQVYERAVRKVKAKKVKAKKVKAKKVKAKKVKAKKVEAKVEAKMRAYPWQ